MGTGGREHVLRADGGHRGPVAVQLVIGQIVDDQAGQGAGDLRGRLEAQREDTHEVVAGRIQLLRRDGRLADAAELGHDVGDGRRGHLRLDGAAHRERPRAAAHVEVRVDAVRVAALLAQEPVEPRIEEPTQQRIHDDQCMEVVDAPRRAHVTHADLRLGRARTVHDHDPSAGTRAVDRRSSEVGLLRTVRPGGEGRGDDVLDGHPVEVAADDDRAGLRPEEPRHGVPREPRGRGRGWSPRSRP